MEKSPYTPVVPLPETDVQLEEIPQTTPMAVPTSATDEITDGSYTQLSWDTTQAQRSPLGVGGSVLEASQVEFVVGHDVGAVTVGVYDASGE